MPQKIKKIVVAYSGGLDTSIILSWLKENYGAQVIACAVDVGQGDDMEAVKEKALKTGASKAYVIDARKEFVTDYIFRALKAEAVYEGKYLMATSLARPIIAEKVVEIAAKENADAVAHGATGKGNDQVRFELTFKYLMPGLKIIAPWREWNIRSREDAVKYARERGIPVPVTKKKPYSSDANIWHISYEGGILEDAWNEPDESMFNLTVSPQDAPDKPEIVTLDFQKGIPVALNSQELGPVELVERLNKIAGAHGIGRTDIVENRLVGMKSRGVYESPAATVLYAAHRDIEHLALDRETLHYKEIVSHKYAEIIYNGLWFGPLKKALDAFIDATQKNVTGTVKLKLYKGNIVSAGRKSPMSLYSRELATFGRDEVYNQKDAEGFINLFGLPLKVQGIVEKKAALKNSKKVKV